jgi:hypothetical protein
MRVSHADAQAFNSGRLRSASMKSRRWCAQHSARVTCPSFTCRMAG